MNILFLTIAKINSLKDRGIYTDLLRKFHEEGHKVYVVNPVERRMRMKTHLLKDEKGQILNIKTLNIQKTNVFEKGISTIAIEYQFLYGVKKYFSTVKFDLVLYSTPPITFSKVIRFIKKRDKAHSYLLLKDIFPQNAIDMKMLKYNGILHKFFLKKEKELYKVSDIIGCMSDANKQFLLSQNPEISSSKVEVNPNSILPLEVFTSDQEKQSLKKKYNLPVDKKIFVYGGNLGKPQGVDFVLETILSTVREDVFFLLIGTGTEYNRIKKWFESNRPKNALLMRGLPKEDYDLLLRACDVGMLFLHPDFTIPNFPSRLLSYLEFKLPVIAATDPNTDVGAVIEKAQCGYWVLSGNQVEMQNAIAKFCGDNHNYLRMKENSWKLLIDKFHVNYSYQLIRNRFQNV